MGIFHRRRRASSVEKAVEKLADGAVSDDRSAGLEGGAVADRGAAPAARQVPATPRQGRKVTIDHDALQAAGMISARSNRSLIAEEFRITRRPLLLRAFGDKAAGKRPGKLVMISSARPGEGKTFCAVNLAMSIAIEADLPVMLVDGDIPRPNIPAVLGIEADRGLIDVIADDDLGISDVLLHTDMDNLAILPAGRPHRLAADLLASDKMERLAEDLARRYPDHVIIFDSPPVLMSSIPGVLARHVGQILFVVRAEKTTQASVESALGQISECENIHLLLNKARTMVASDSPGGGHGYDR